MAKAGWTNLTDNQQLALAREALRQASETLAQHAEVLAGEIEEGALDDKGGPDALRLFAAVIRTARKPSFESMGTPD